MADITSYVKQQDVDEISSYILGLAKEMMDAPDEAISESNFEYDALFSDEAAPEPEPSNLDEFQSSNIKRLDEYRKKHPSKQATDADIFNTFSNTTKTAKTDAFKDAARSAAKSGSSDWVDQVDYHPGNVTVGGKKIQYRLHREKVNWGDYLDTSKTPNVSANIETLTKLFTQAVKQNFGGFNRIKTVVVVGGQLILNDVLYVPELNSDVLAALPLDAADYFSCGCMAQFFDWAKLREMRSLYSLQVDDVRFYTTTIADSLGLGYRIGACSVFNVVKSLQVFTLAGETTTREEINTPKARRIKEKVAKDKKHLTVFDVLKTDMYKGANGFCDYAVTNLKNYATHRGQKGILRFVGGTAMRFGIATIGYILKTAANVVTNGLTPVSEDEIYK